MDFCEKILIGGRALVALGSSRNTLDIDYLVNDTTSKEQFLHEDGIDYCNANGHEFFRDVYKIEQGRQVASPQSLLDLKAFAWIQLCQIGYFRRADDAEYDIKFLCREFGLIELVTAKKYLSESELAEVQKIIDSVVNRKKME